MTENDIKNKAEEFAREHKKRIARDFTNRSIFASDTHPVSVFMAGSPGAGKTEFSKGLVSLLSPNSHDNILRIDGDELRELLPGYNGENAYLFQGAVSILVDKIHDTALDQNQTFILDGTFSKYEKAVNNIERSLHKKRLTIVFYIYQNPDIAWKFTLAREAKEGRHIPKEAFIQEFLDARDTVKRVSGHFDKDVMIFFVKKNFTTHEVEAVREITAPDEVDEFIAATYTKESLEKLL